MKKKKSILKLIGIILLNAIMMVSSVYAIKSEYKNCRIVKCTHSHCYIDDNNYNVVMHNVIDSSTGHVYSYSNINDMYNLDDKKVVTIAIDNNNTSNDYTDDIIKSTNFKNDLGMYISIFLLLILVFNVIIFLI